MMYFMFLFGFFFVFWMVGVSCQPSPYYGVLSLVLGAASGCAVLVIMGGSFVSLVLFLIYLGGMLVLFAYSTALVAESGHIGWNYWESAFYVVIYVLCIVFAGVYYYWAWSVEGFGCATVDGDGPFTIRFDFSGVSWFYCFGSMMFVIVGWGLLLTLFVVLALVHGLSRGVVRAI
uniref:NADH-ubiquinone oxidoreductase chain 6 n=1 Tax=Chelydra serpentina TaxID=8475 RepID=Q20FE2_CHESE|nr:NADH dehydrogenase subunit 6 [Chelydra serpentina]ABB22866.1 NADH dehydrogenase subunit 6 [Chelydra serpentina]ABK81689.1 NADH dehydrogenase subunit 6 [Chelydra serpentina]